MQHDRKEVLDYIRENKTVICHEPKRCLTCEIYDGDLYDFTMDAQLMIEDMDEIVEEFVEYSMWELSLDQRNKTE